MSIRSVLAQLVGRGEPEEAQQAVERVRQLLEDKPEFVTDEMRRRVWQVSVESTCRQLDTAHPSREKRSKA